MLLQKPYNQDRRDLRRVVDFCVETSLAKRGMSYQCVDIDMELHMMIPRGMRMLGFHARRRFMPVQNEPPASLTRFHTGLRFKRRNPALDSPDAATCQAANLSHSIDDLAMPSIAWLLIHDQLFGLTALNIDTCCKCTRQDEPPREEVRIVRRMQGARSQLIPCERDFQTASVAARQHEGEGFF